MNNPYLCPVSKLNKLERFAEMRTMPNVVQFHFGNLQKGFHPLRGHWKKDFFKNDNPVILELGCGKGEYTVGLARRFPEKNFIGVDIKGARMYTGAVKAIEENLNNAAFLRTRIDFINAIFDEGEVDEIWITFPDPQKEKEKKRLTAPGFLRRYAHLLKPGGIIHLKTDSVLLHEYTLDVIKGEGLHRLAATADVYGTIDDPNDILISIKTTYEKMFLARGMKITYVSFSLPSLYGGNTDFYPFTLLENPST